MKNNHIIWIVIIILAVLGGWYFVSKNNNNANPLKGGMTNGDMNVPMNGGGSNIPENNTSVNPAKPDDTIQAEVKSFTVSGSNFKFDPSTLSVNKGDTVKITFKNIGGFHDFKIDEFNAGTKRTNTGEQETIAFVASKSGSFEYYCSVGTHRAMGMKGTLVVK